MPVFDKGKRSELKKLEQFAKKERGVEAYLEPATTIRPQSLLLVARNGDWARAEIADKNQAATLCKKLGIPLYDAAIVGYPDRMRGVKRAPAPDVPSAQELEAWFSESKKERDKRKERE
ncbi:MAG: hypothetical protein ACRD1T_20755 [Acidimicrobiia bacterium]